MPHYEQQGTESIGLLAMTYAFIIALQQKVLFIKDGPVGLPKNGVDIGSPGTGWEPWRGSGA